MDRRAFLGMTAGASVTAWPAWAQDSTAVAFENMAADVLVGEGDPPLQPSIKELMAAFAVPAVSIAVIDNFQVLWAKGFGVPRPGAVTRIDANTLFQAASISKAPSAVATMSLVRDGKLTLDTDVNSLLKSWRVPDSPLSTTEKVTLRRIMSHTAGLGVHGFAGYTPGETLPSVAQILDGTRPANSPPVRLIATPGTREIYSGGGVVVEQLLINEATGKSFPDTLAERVLQPFGMNASTYSQPLPDGLTGRAASGTYANGTTVAGGWHVYPEMAPAGLWTTPSDLAVFLIGISNARRGITAPVSQAQATDMLTPPLASGGFGLGFQLTFGGDTVFGHTGGNEGFRSVMQMDWQTGKGAIVMINSDAGDAIQRPIMMRLRGLYGLNGPAFTPQPILSTLVLVRLRGLDAALRAFDRQFAANPKMITMFELNSTGYGLMAAGDIAGAIRLFKRNVEAFPNDAGVYDSLGEAYRAKGQTDLAIANYRKSLELDPSNDNAKQVLKELKAK